MTASVTIEHPNRMKSTSRMTRWIVACLLAASAMLMIVISLGGWEVIEGAKALQVMYIASYLGLAYLVARWRRGVLPVTAALAVVLLIFAAVATPGWFERDDAGFVEPPLAAGLLGLLTMLLIPLQLLLIGFALSGFRQAWNVEVEHPSQDEPTAIRG